MTTAAQQIAFALSGQRAQRLADIDRAHPISIADPLSAAVATLFRAASPETFSGVCEALADAADADDFDLPFLNAVDRAQGLAVACGLVRTVGQDAVQWIMGQAFKRCRVHQRPSAEPLPSQYDQAAKSTVEALMYSLRERGAAALSERACRDRLAFLSSDQIPAVIVRLIALRPRYPKITDDLLFKLGGLL
jgi:hypothetical protein